MRRRLVFAALLLPGLALIQAGCGQARDARETPQEEKTAAAVDNRVLLTVEFGDLRESIQFESAWTDSTTVLDLLLAAAKNAGADVNYDGKGQSAFVNGIGGFTGGTDALGWWIYRVNGKLVNQGSDVRKLQPGDHVLWKLGEYN